MVKEARNLVSGEWYINMNGEIFYYENGNDEGAKITYLNGAVHEGINLERYDKLTLPLEGARLINILEHRRRLETSLEIVDNILSKRKGNHQGNLSEQEDP